jgi:DNA-binding CsgD family transcriptional regulator
VSEYAVGHADRGRAAAVCAYLDQFGFSGDGARLKLESEKFFHALDERFVKWPNEPSDGWRLRLATERMGRLLTEIRGFVAGSIGGSKVGGDSLAKLEDCGGGVTEDARLTANADETKDKADCGRRKRRPWTPSKATQKVIDLMGQGLSNDAIARRSDVNVSTSANNLRKIRQRARETRRLGPAQPEKRDTA